MKSIWHKLFANYIILIYYRQRTLMIVVVAVKLNKVSILS